MTATSHCIAHVDMDAFYASIEVRDDPSLRGRPVVVGGAGDQRGVVAAASYEARRFGIHSAMPMARAERLCATLVRLPVDFEKYRGVSREVMEILGKYSPLVEPLSLDEAFLDLTGTERALGPPSAVGPRIKQEIRDRTRLTASVGIAPVKFVAKIASDLRKPDGLVLVAVDEVLAFLHPLPISRLWGVGPRTQETLTSMGLITIGDVATADPRRLERKLGDHGRHLCALARGEDVRGVVPDAEAKSYSHEQTFARDQLDLELLQSVLLDQSLRVARRLRRDGVRGRTVQLKLRLHDFQTTTRQRTLAESSAATETIYETACQLLAQHWNGAPVRLLGVGMSGIAPPSPGIRDLFHGERDEKRERLAATIDGLEERFRRGLITRAKILAHPEVEGTGTPSDRDLE